MGCYEINNFPLSVLTDAAYHINLVKLGTEGFHFVVFFNKNIVNLRSTNAFSEKVSKFRAMASSLSR